MKKLPLILTLFLVPIIIQAADLPNIVVLISDDLGRLDTSVYGSPDARTPTLQSLAEQGMTFDNAYVASPSCCPNRASLLTGLMPARHGAHPNHSQMKPGTPELTGILKGLSYQIASFGKVQHGSRPFTGCDFHYKDPQNMSRDLQALIDSGKLEDAPICLFVGDRRPHVPWIKEMIYNPDEITLPSTFIDTRETREHWARYLSDITHMDTEMHRVLKVARKHMGNDFICFFTSDHGGQWPFGKWNLYDSGTRIPLIVTWPGKIEAGVRTDAMVSWVDIVPTLIELAGAEYPDDIDGRSFAKVLTGQSKTHRDKIFTTHTGDTDYNIYPIRSVRVGNYKYIHNLLPDAVHTNHSDILRNDGRGAYWDSWDAAAKRDSKAAATIEAYYTRPEFQLFDLENDPLEQSNLANNRKSQTLLKQLRSDLTAWTTLQGDDLQPHREPYLKTDSLPDIREEIVAKRNQR
ncbi:MAG: sulfatase [Verrucomicrobia bacterium]|nr:sulfatase [Verrucomicrobiota bacterium]MDA1068358.1 sulfatase [Verrucomicrobiota bacterium]